jgi:translation elongation factor EF-Ts
MVAAHTGFERWIEAYAHEGRIGVLVELAFRDPFAAKTEEFRRFARDVALQVAAMAPESVDALLGQDCLKQPGLSVSECLEATSTLLGDRIQDRRAVPA